MLRRFLLPIIAVFAIFLTATAASADSIVTYDLSGVTLSDGGTLTGSFTIDYGTTNTLTAWDIIASAKGNFPGFEYDNSDSTISGNSVLDIRADGSGNELQIAFANGTTLPIPSGTALLHAQSSDHEPLGGNRTVTAGTVVIGTNQNNVTTVPLPSSVWSALTLLIGLGLWHARKKAIAARI